MRKGFTRKPQADAPATPVKNYITPSGLERLKDEHRFLLTRERPAVTEVVAWAAGNGDRATGNAGTGNAGTDGTFPVFRPSQGNAGTDGTFPVFRPSQICPVSRKLGNVPSVPRFPCPQVPHIPVILSEGGTSRTRSPAAVERSLSPVRRRKLRKEFLPPCCLFASRW
jgi:hypothetical protein